MPDQPSKPPLTPAEQRQAEARARLTASAAELDDATDAADAANDAWEANQTATTERAAIEAEAAWEAAAYRHRTALREHMEVTGETLAEIEADARALRGAS